MSFWENKKNYLYLVLISFFLISLCAANLLAISKADLMFQEIPLIITASKYPQTKKKTAANVCVVSSEDIKKHGYRTLSDVLRNVSGFYVTNDRNYEYLGVRGAHVNGDYLSRILLMINSTPINDPIYGSGPIGNELGIDMDIVQRIEVIKGPASALYGTYALFAVINVITYDKDAEAGSASKINMLYGSDEYSKGSLIVFETLGDSKSILLSATGLTHLSGDMYSEEFDSPTTNNGVYQDNNNELAEIYFTNIQWNKFSLQGFVNNRKKELPTASWGTIFNDPDASTKDGNYFLELRYRDKFFKKNEYELKLFNRHYNYSGTYAYLYDDDDIGNYKENFKDESHADWLGAEFTNTVEISETNILVSGIQYAANYYLKQKGYDVGILSEDYYYLYQDNKQDYYVWALYAENIWTASYKLNLISGFRYDHYSSFGGTFNPRLAVIYDLSDNSTIKAVYGSAFRAPNIYEQYYSDGNITQAANPDLDPETLQTYELIAENNINRSFSITTSLYKTILKENIVQRSNPDMLSDETGEALLQFVNLGEIEYLGIDLSSNYNYKNMTFSLGYNWQKSEDKLSGETAENSPENLIKLGIGTDLMKNKLSIVLDNRYTDIRHSMGGAGGRIKSQILSDLCIVAEDVLKNTTFTLKIFNLFDEVYYDPVGAEFTQTGIQQDRRNFYIKLGYEF